MARDDAINISMPPEIGRKGKRRDREGTLNKKQKHYYVVILPQTSCFFLFPRCGHGI